MFPNLAEALRASTNEYGLISYDIAKFASILYGLEKQFDSDFKDDDRIIPLDFLEWVEEGGQFPG